MKANVYDRLYDKKSYTGVYRKRFEGDGRINADTQVSMIRTHHSKYVGSTNTNSNEVCHNISSLMRPNLRRSSDVKNGIKKPDPVVSAAKSPQKVHMVAPPPLPFQRTVPASPKPVTNSAPPVPAEVDGKPLDTTDPHSVLKFVFQFYCRFGRTGAKGFAEKTLDNSNFAKFCRECPNLVNSKFTKTSVDLIFVKSKKKTARRLTYPRFLDALGMIASQKFPNMELEKSVPLLLEEYIARLPCLQESQQMIVEADLPKVPAKENEDIPANIQMLEPTEAPHLINLLQQLQAKESTDDEATVGKEPPSEDELSAAGTVAAPIPQ